MAIVMSTLFGATANILIIGITGWVSPAFGFCLFFIFIVLAVIGACFLGAENEITIVTSINASYLCMRGLSMIIGGYPAESQVFSVMFNKYAEPIEIGPMFYIYLGSFIGGCFFFVFLQKQCKILRPHKVDCEGDALDDDFTKSGIDQTMEQMTPSEVDAEKGAVDRTKVEVKDVTDGKLGSEKVKVEKKPEAAKSV
jgi:hypothetical protein